MVMEMDYTDLHFNNVQLMKLVSSAEIIFQHLYDLVSTENKTFIDQWFCYKQEYDEACSNNAQFDVNENVQECPTLSRIDEVSENEKFSSVSSDSTVTSSDSSISFEKPVSDWCRTLSFNSNDIKQYMNWLESRDYKRMWTNIYNNAQKNSDLNKQNYDNEQHCEQNSDERHFIPIETSHTQWRPIVQPTNLTRQNLYNHQYYNNIQHETLIDRHIRYLQEIRHVLLRIRENINPKLKKDKLKYSAEFEECLKIDVAFEIIDISIEIKNQIKLGHNIPDLSISKDEINAIILDCLSILSVNEIRYLLMTYLANVLEMRKCSREHDQHLLQLGKEISDQKYLLWRMYMIINKNKRSYKNQCLTLRETFEQKSQLMNKDTTDESNDECLSSDQGRKLLSVIEKNDFRDSLHSDSEETKDMQPLLPCVPSIPEKSLKTLQHISGSSSGAKVTREKKKIIMTKKK